MPLSRPALYREVLTPALHRRFTGSALIVLVLCYFVGILIGEKTSCKFHETRIVTFSLTMPSSLAMVSLRLCWHPVLTTVRLHTCCVHPENRLRPPWYVIYTV